MASWYFNLTLSATKYGTFLSSTCGRILFKSRSFTDSATVLPIQIYLWKSTAARGFLELTAAGVMVLLTFLILMNGLAVYIRQRFETKW